MVVVAVCALRLRFCVCVCSYHVACIVTEWRGYCCRFLLCAPAATKLYGPASNRCVFRIPCVLLYDDVFICSQQTYISGARCPTSSRVEKNKRMRWNVEHLRISKVSREARTFEGGGKRKRETKEGRKERKKERKKGAGGRKKERKSRRSSTIQDRAVYCMIVEFSYLVTTIYVTALLAIQDVCPAADVCKVLQPCCLHGPLIS